MHEGQRCGLTAYLQLAIEQFDSLLEGQMLVEDWRKMSTATVLLDTEHQPRS